MVVFIFVVVGLDLNEGEKELSVGTIFEEDTILRDAYSGIDVTVKNGKIKLNTPFSIVLLEKKS